MNHYVNQNHDVVAVTAKHHGFVGDTFWWKIDRKNRICHDELSDIFYVIPDHMDLS